MKITANGVDGYLDPEGVITANYIDYNGGNKEIQISSGHGFSNIKVNSKEEAIRIIKNITEHKEANGKEKETYLDGFKAGLEYALKMQKATK